MIKVTIKRAIRSALRRTKPVVIRVPALHTLGKKAKRVLFPKPDTATQEIYNHHLFYPTIREYHSQQKDTRKSDPLISILLPTYNTPEVYLRECIESIIVQSYSTWELCIADDNSPDKNVVKVIKEYQKKDKRIKLVERKQNGHISEATNSALGIATGDFVALMDHDDVLWPNALYEMASVIRGSKNVDLIYSDEDKIDGTGLVHSYPFLKPSLSPEFLESCNYITHFSCIRTSLMHTIGGFRKGYEGAQDWDLFVRIVDTTNQVIHLPKIIYSWRMHAGSTAADTDNKPYVYEAQKKLLDGHLVRQKKTGEIQKGIIPQHRTVLYDAEPGSSVSVVVKSNSAEDVQQTLQTLATSESGDYEVLVLSSKRFSKREQDMVASAAVVPVTFIEGDESDLKGSYKGTSLLFITAAAKNVQADWVSRVLSDTQIKGVGLVYPVILNEDLIHVQSAGYGLGYGAQGVVNMLEGMPFHDPHYARGLYVKSRRNISAGSEAVFAMNASIFEGYYLPSYQKSMIKIAQSLLSQGLRHVYTPYLQFSMQHAPIIASEDLGKQYAEDIYLNPHFNKANSRMEINQQ